MVMQEVYYPTFQRTISFTRCEAAFEQTDFDLKDVKGQKAAKRALEIAAAGGHNIAMYGPPGTGKTMLAKAFSHILPTLSFDEILESSDFIQDFINTLKIQEQPIHKIQEPSIHKIQEPPIHKTPLYFLIEKYPDDVESIIKREKTFSREELEACIKKSEKDNLRYEKAMSIFTKSHTAFVFKKTNAYIYFCKEIKTFSKHSKNLWKDVDQKMYKSFLSHNSTLFKNIYLHA